MINVVKVYEYCEMDLRETIVTYRIQKHPEIYKKILKGCVKAVANVHQKKICHQDLKPRNFLLHNGFYICIICEFIK